MDPVNALFNLQQTQYIDTECHYQVDSARWSKFSGVSNATESQSFRMATNGQNRLITIPRSQNLYSDNPLKFQGDLLIWPRDQARLLPDCASFMPPDPYSLNFFTDASYPGDDTWGNAPKLTSPENPAGLAVIWKSWPGLANQKWNKRGYQLYKCSDFRVAELNALTLGLETAALVSRLQPQLRRVTLFTDCQDAIRDLMIAEKHQDNPLIQRAVAASKEMDAKGIRVLVHWTPGHADVEGNEKADDVAFEARTCFAPKWVPTEMPEQMTAYEIPEYMLPMFRPGSLLGNNACSTNAPRKSRAIAYASHPSKKLQLSTPPSSPPDDGQTSWQQYLHRNDIDKSLKRQPSIKRKGSSRICEDGPKRQKGFQSGSTSSTISVLPIIKYDIDPKDTQAEDKKDKFVGNIDTYEAEDKDENRDDRSHTLGRTPEPEKTD